MVSGGEHDVGGESELVGRLFAAMPDGIWMFDDRGITTFANARMAEIVGRTVDEMQGLPVIDLLDEVGREQFETHLAELGSTETGRDNLETRFSRPVGEPVWGLVSYAPVFDDDGRRIGWLHRVTPYTERKELVETLLVREQQLATAQVIAHIGSWEWEIDDDHHQWSDEMCRIFGVEPGTFPTYDEFLALIHPDDRAHALATIDRALAGGGEYGLDHRVLRPDGTVRWVRARGVVERGPDGTVKKLSGTSQDITDIARSDQQAAEANRRLYLLQQMAMAANGAKSLREALMMAAGGVPEHTSWEAVGAYLYDEEGVVEPLDLGPSAAADPDLGLAEQARTTGVLAVGRPSVKAETHSLVAVPVVLGDAVVAVVELLADELPPDETSRQLMGQIVNQLAIVAERERSASQLAEARDDAMEASRLKSEFLATMSHEIRTPMNGVIGLTDLLLRTSLDEHQRRLTENLQGAGLTLLGIINDILDLSKIESGKLELEAADFDVRSVFDQVASVLSGPAHAKGLELVVSCHPDVPAQLRGDAVRFGQVLTNLGSNAVKFTDHGEVVIQAQVEHQSYTDVVLRVDVTDTGVGVDPESRDRLFDAFTQGDPSTTRRHGGTGLGLAISSQLVQALGGEIWVTSTLGQGSTFSFTARLGRAVGAAPRQRPDTSRRLQGRRVLVVDDNETNRFILEEQLSAWQLLPIAVSSAVEALATLREAARSGSPFDIALLDLVMPGTDGLDLARQVTADPSLAQVSMLLLTSDQSVTRTEVEDAGIRASLSKPVRHSELRGALLAVLGGPADVPLPESSSGPGLGIRALVVEDNQVNQLVATGMLEGLGCTVDLASDGIEAVELLTRPHDYAVVLMDCRMPRMDGFDATRQVRRREPVGRRVPIIAMTASALEGERERCLASGMDDYLTKPVDSAELERVVREWVQPTAARPAAAPDEPEPTGRPRIAVGDAQILDAERVAMLDGLVKDGVSFFERTAASFMGRVGSQLMAIREAVDRDNAMSLLTSAHQLKGSALNLGLPRVAAVSARLEALGIAGRTEGGGALLTDLTDEIEAAVAALQRATAARG